MKPWHKLTPVERAELIRRKGLRQEWTTLEAELERKRRRKPRRRWQGQGPLAIESLGDPKAIVGVIGQEIEPPIPDAVRALEDWLDGDKL